MGKFNNRDARLKIQQKQQQQQQHHNHNQNNNNQQQQDKRKPDARLLINKKNLKINNNYNNNAGTAGQIVKKRPLQQQIQKQANNVLKKTIFNKDTKDSLLVLAGVTSNKRLSKVLIFYSIPYPLLLFKYPSN